MNPIDQVPRRQHLWMRAMHLYVIADGTSLDRSFKHSARRHRSSLAASTWQVPASERKLPASLIDEQNTSVKVGNGSEATPRP